MSVPINNFRKQIPEFLKFFLSQQGQTIPNIEQDKEKSIPGDNSQSIHKDQPIWHSRLTLIENMAKELQLDSKFWGPQRESADFYNIIDQEISKLRQKKIITNWNSTKHIGIFRLADANQIFQKPAPSLDGVQNILAYDDANLLKQTFMAILEHSRKDNTYKFALARALVEHCRDTPYDSQDAYKVSYDYLAEKFLEYYWHQECKFRIRQTFKIDAVPEVIKAIRKVFVDSQSGNFRDVDESKKQDAKHIILKNVFGSQRSKKSLVVPKFQNVMEGRYANPRKVFYEYDNDEKILTLHPDAFAFFKNNNRILSKAVLVEWAKLLERMNNSLPRLIAKIEQDEAKRESLTKYRKEYLTHMDHCFYCCNKLETRYIHVDHFLPWSYIFEDEAWNLVLACSDCNLKKSNSLVQEDWITDLIKRNNRYRNNISLLDHSIKIIDTKRGWKYEIENHYTTCQEYGFNVIKMP